jgi:hypothetical protein
MTPAVPELISPAAVQADADAAKRDALAFVEANKVPVTDLVSFERANQVRTEIGRKQKAIIAQLAKPKKWAHELHQWFCSLEAAAMVPFDILDAYEREQIRTFNDAETARRQARERELAEARRREDEARAATEAAALERAGEHQMAAAVVTEAIAAPLPVVVLPNALKEIQKFRRSWKWRLTNAALVPREFLVVDTVRLNKYAVAMRESAKVPGVEFYYVDDPTR